MPRVLVAGASGQVGARLTALLGRAGHEIVAASRSSGIDTVAGTGLDTAMRGVEVVVDVTNVSSRDAREISRFFESSSRHVAEAARREGVAHYVVLSVVGADRMPDSPYMRGKVLQERVVGSGGVPFTIARATQFFEFVAGFGDVFDVGGDVRLPAARMQPIAVDDVALALADVAMSSPVNGVVDIAGPRAMPIREAVSRVLASRGDRRNVVASADVRYFGAVLRDDTLLPGPAGPRGHTTLEEWLE